MPTHAVNVGPSELFQSDDPAFNLSSTSPFSGVGLPRKLEKGTCNLLAPAPIPKLTEKMARGACIIRQRTISENGHRRTKEMQKETSLGEEEEEEEEVRTMDGGKESNHR